MSVQTSIFLGALRNKASERLFKAYSNSIKWEIEQIVIISIQSVNSFFILPRQHVSVCHSILQLCLQRRKQRAAVSKVWNWRTVNGLSFVYVAQFWSALNFPISSTIISYISSIIHLKCACVATKSTIQDLLSERGEILLFLLQNIFLEAAESIFFGICATWMCSKSNFHIMNCSPRNVRKK